MKRGLKIAVGLLVMPLAIAAVAVVWIAAHTHGPTPSALSALRAHLAAARPEQHEGIVAAAVAREGELPWRSATTLTFLAQAEDDAPPRVVGDFNGWPEPGSGANDGRMERLGSSSWYAAETSVLPRSRIEYLIAHGERLGIDPHNPKHLPGVGGEVSEVRLQGCREVPELATGGREAPAGKVVTEQRTDRADRERKVAIYTPAGYDAARGPYPLVLFHDGSLMLEQGGVARVLDRLIAARRVVPLVAVFVDPVDRATDYAFDASWREWFTGDLLPDTARRFAVAGDPAHRAVVGVSRGAVGAVDLARTEAAAFGFCGLLIPATEPVPVVEALRAQPPLASLRVSAVLALYDAHWLDDGRRLVDALRGRGATVESVEVPEGHGVETWRRHVGMLLERFAPGARAGL